MLEGSFLGDIQRVIALTNNIQETEVADLESSINFYLIFYSTKRPRIEGGFICLWFIKNSTFKTPDALII